MTLFCRLRIDPPVGVDDGAPFGDEAEPVGRGRIGDGRFKRLDPGGAVGERRVVSRSAALGEGAEGDRSPGFGVPAAGAGSEVAVFEPVGIAFERDQLGVMDQSVDHRDRGGVITEDLTPR